MPLVVGTWICHLSTLPQPFERIKSVILSAATRHSERSEESFGKPIAISRFIKHKQSEL